MADISVREAIYTTRAMRRLKKEKVSDEDLQFLVDAATQAPSGENAQRWAFVVVTDAEQRRRLGEIYRELGHEVIRDGTLTTGTLSPEDARVHRSAMVLVEHLGEAPAIIVPCVRGRPPRDRGAVLVYWGSIFPAIQNLMLAARSIGLGTTLTTLHKAREEDVKAVLGIPDDVETVALIPVGVPKGTWGRPLRRPSWEVTHWNRWNEQRPPADD